MKFDDRNKSVLIRFLLEVVSFDFVAPMVFVALRPKILGSNFA